MSSRNQLVNVLTKKGASSIELLNVLKSGIIHKKKLKTFLKNWKKTLKKNQIMIKKVAKVLIIMILSSIL